MRSSFVIRLRLLMILRAAFELNLSVQFQSTGFLPSSLNVKLNSPGGRHCGNQVKLTRIVLGGESEARRLEKRHLWGIEWNGHFDSGNIRMGLCSKARYSTIDILVTVDSFSE